MMFANQSTSPNMFAICSCRAHLNLENIFRRCQISHWTKLEAPYKGCTVICTFFIKCSSLKIMKFFIEIFFIELLAEHCASRITWFRTRALGFGGSEPFSRPFSGFRSTSWLELARKTDLKFHKNRPCEKVYERNFLSEEKSENSRELEWYYLDYVSRFLLGDETMFIYCCLLFIYGQ